MEGKQHKCNYCAKEYSTYASLWTHNKYHHSLNKLNNTEKNKIYNCSKCNKKYGYRQSRNLHEKTCSSVVIAQPSMELEIEKTKLEQTKEDIIKIKLEIKLQRMLQKSSQINTTTIKAINKMLMSRATTINITNNINHNHINNNYFVGVGKENVLETITDSEKWDIMKSGMDSLEHIVNLVHCGNHGKFNNTLIMNLKDNTAYRYDDKLGYFIVSDKKELLDELVNSRIIDIENLYNNLSNDLSNKQNEHTKIYIQRFIESINNEEKEFLSETAKFANFKSFKIDSVTKLLYNNHDKIKKNIALMINNNSNEDS